MQGINVIINAFIHGLDPVCHIDLPLEGLGLIHAGQAFHLADQLPGFFGGDKSGGLNGIHQQFQLGHLKQTGAYPIASPPLGRDHIQAINLQGFQIVIKALPLGADAPFLQLLGQLGDGEPVILIGLLQQDFHQIEQLEFLSGTLGHTFSSFHWIRGGLSSRVYRVAVRSPPSTQETLCWPV